MKKQHLNLLLIVSIMFLQQIGLALIAPSLPQMSKAVNVSIASILAFFILGQAIGQIFWGFASDLLGRKKLLIAGLFLFAISSFLIPFALNPYSVDFLRFIQGFSTSSMYAVTTALISDQSENNQILIGSISLSDLGFGLSWAILPLAGGLFAELGNWKTNFYIMTIIILAVAITSVFCITETRDFKKKKTTLQTAKIFLKMFIDYKYIVIPILMSLPNIFFFVFCSNSPVILTHNFHFTATKIGLFISILGIFYILINYLNVKIFKKLDTAKTIKLCIIFFVISTIIQLIFALSGILNIYTLALPMIINVMIWGVIFPHISTTALNMYKEQAGTCSSNMGFIFYVLTFFGIFLFGYYFKINFVGIAAFTFIIAMISIVCYVYAFKNKVLTPVVKNL